ncbi:fumarylacetoacetase [Granulicella mallensis]|uniref:fumarylacetoacetase n=1 Tax=Granulicella mallensis (strain ATCC BAA-1857 / DSM 23137 / MP5ACTX8) TaxID=682795 RepID=G8NQZ1_GRAMM|nr:fumarylacetoacetase [Granulicella mallensis]AEU34976.1 fumarylacetoacetase [Granulicella mallensis MP5ACTX8]
MTKGSMLSWVDGANEPHGFGLNHLPYGAFRKDDVTRLCVRIGDWLLDLEACVRHGLLEGFAPSVRDACSQSTLNDLLAAGPEAWQALRAVLTACLSDDGYARTAADWLLVPLSEVELVLPIDPRGYTDFYASLHHARRVGELFRPDNPLLPNYKHVPIAYNGRASSVIASGTSVRRPWGQRRPANQETQPTFEPSAALDYELELAFVVGQGNALGEPISIANAHEHLFGVTLLNDWSARDVQAWEYQPLGPFLGKSFATSVSPWITPMAALESFRVAPAARAQGDPQPLPYLLDDADQQHGAFDIQVEVLLSTEASRAAGLAPMPVSRGNARGLYWTAAQMVAHHTSNGCNLRPGDLLATGTISGPERASAGCLLELTRNGAESIALPNGEHRAWLQDGDEVSLRALCRREGFLLIELGECVGHISEA